MSLLITHKDISLRPGGFWRELKSMSAVKRKMKPRQRERQRQRERTLPLSNPPLEKRRRHLVEGTVWPKERRWEAASGPLPTQRGSLKPREGKALAQGHTALMRQPQQRDLGSWILP